MKPKPGRPAVLASAKRRNIYIEDAVWDKAVKIGNGSASNGIKKAIESVKSLPKR